MWDKCRYHSNHLMKTPLYLGEIKEYWVVGLEHIILNALDCRNRRFIIIHIVKGRLLRHDRSDFCCKTEQGWLDFNYRGRRSSRMIPHGATWFLISPGHETFWWRLIESNAGSTLGGNIISFFRDGFIIKPFLIGLIDFHGRRGAETVNKESANSIGKCGVFDARSISWLPHDEFVAGCLIKDVESWFYEPKEQFLAGRISISCHHFDRSIQGCVSKQEPRKGINPLRRVICQGWKTSTTLLVVADFVTVVVEFFNTSTISERTAYGQCSI